MVAEPLLIPRILLREPTPLERTVLGETVCLKTTTGEVPKEKTKRAGLYASMAEYWIERGHVGEALKSLTSARSTLLRDVPRREELLAEWQGKGAQWQGWSDKIASAERVFLEGRGHEGGHRWAAAGASYRTASESLADVAREAALETLPVLVHQVMHVHRLEESLQGMRRVDYVAEAIRAGHRFRSREEALEGVWMVYGMTDLEEEMGRLHYESHRQIFWSPVSYDPVPGMIQPTSAFIREAVGFVQRLCNVSWTREDDARLFERIEFVRIAGEKGDPSGSVAAEIARLISKCGDALMQSPRSPENMSLARDHFASAKSLLTTVLGERAPDFIVMLVREMEGYLKNPFTN